MYVCDTLGIHFLICLQIACDCDTKKRECEFNSLFENNFFMIQMAEVMAETKMVDAELKAKLESFDKSTLKSTTTAVKNTLPDQAGKYR